MSIAIKDFLVFSRAALDDVLFMGTSVNRHLNRMFTHIDIQYRISPRSGAANQVHERS